MNAKMNIIRQKLTIQITFFVFILCTFATIIRPLLVEQTVLFTYIGTINAVCFGLLYLFFSKASARAWHPYLLFFAGFSALLPLTITSGGVNSQFAVLLPMAPILVVLIINIKAAWLVALMLVCFVISFYFLSDLLPDITNEIVDDTKTKARTIWLCIGIVFGAAFGTAFDNINQSLSRKLHKQAFKDALTGINNRRSIMTSFSQMRIRAISANSHLALLMIDVDHFKQLNDQHGHQFGDKCLQDVAKAIKESVRDPEDAAGRYGGEEFLVLCTGVSNQQSEMIANKIRVKIENLKIQTEQGKCVNLTVTIGFCCFKGESIPCEKDLLHIADDALYVGKKQGRNRVIGGSALA